MSNPSLSEMMAEWKHVYQTRLGILCEDREPTPEQESIAHQEADRAVLAMQNLPTKARFQPELAETWAARSGKD